MNITQNDSELDKHNDLLSLQQEWEDDQTIESILKHTSIEDNNHSKQARKVSFDETLNTIHTYCSKDMKKASQRKRSDHSERRMNKKRKYSLD